MKTLVYLGTIIFVMTQIRSFGSRTGDYYDGMHDSMVIVMVCLVIEVGWIVHNEFAPRITSWFKRLRRRIGKAIAGDSE